MTSDMAWQLDLLLRLGVDQSGQSLTINDLARRSRLSRQTFQKLLDGTSQQPRLNTLRVLTAIYGVSLDYFSFSNTQTATAYLMQHRLRHSTPLIQEIASNTQHLSPQARRNIETMVSWMESISQATQKPREHNQYAATSDE